MINLGLVYFRFCVLELLGIRESNILIIYAKQFLYTVLLKIYFTN